MESNLGLLYVTSDMLFQETAAIHTSFFASTLAKVTHSLRLQSYDLRRFAEGHAAITGSETFEAVTLALNTAPFAVAVGRADLAQY